jgi:hypothetical protein
MPQRLLITRCARCRKPIALPFDPLQPKVCDDCYVPRPPIDNRSARRSLDDPANYQYDPNEDDIRRL